MALKRPAETSQARGLAGTPVARPLLRGGEEGVGQRLLGEFEAAEQPDEARQHPAAFGAIDAVEIDHSGGGRG